MSVLAKLAASVMFLVSKPHVLAAQAGGGGARGRLLTLACLCAAAARASLIVVFDRADAQIGQVELRQFVQLPGQPELTPCQTMLVGELGVFHVGEVGQAGEVVVDGLVEQVELQGLAGVAELVAVQCAERILRCAAVQLRQIHMVEGEEAALAGFAEQHFGVQEVARQPRLFADLIAVFLHHLRGSWHRDRTGGECRAPGRSSRCRRDRRCA